MEVLGQGERNRGGDHRGTEKGWGGSGVRQTGGVCEID